MKSPVGTWHDRFGEVSIEWRRKGLEYSFDRQGFWLITDANPLRGAGTRLCLGTTRYQAIEYLTARGYKLGPKP